MDTSEVPLPPPPILCPPPLSQPGINLQPGPSSPPSKPSYPVLELVPGQLSHPEPPSSSSFEPSATRQNRAWNSLLKTPPPSAGEEDLQFIEPKFADDGDVLQIDEEVLIEGAREWETKVVGFFLDKKLPYSIVKENVLKKWKLLGSMDIALDGDMYYFSFSSEEDRGRVIDEGAFHMAGKLFVVRPWTREVEDNRGSVRSVPIWVKLYNVPKHLWNGRGFSYITNRIGKPLFMDKTTEKKQMLTYARICVEVSAEKELPLEIKMKVSSERTVIISLEYPWKPLICTRCKLFGHSSNNCDQNRTERKAPQGRQQLGKKVQPDTGNTKFKQPQTKTVDRAVWQPVQGNRTSREKAKVVAPSVTVPVVHNKFSSLIDVDDEADSVEPEATGKDPNIQEQSNCADKEECEVEIVEETQLGDGDVQIVDDTAQYESSKEVVTEPSSEDDDNGDDSSDTDLEEGTAKELLLPDSVRYLLPLKKSRSNN
ncbi:zinc ion binding / nucleic acid binding protein [Thalictrum thalictroides]|uniref:Zinc ion binding / nucleic acid binding protein n=1 Tax=Thalictrum thalictroides TaxID=46969 RepID=A0A7J6VVJ9_THATH|nr:zinc ion binding / nucleic acid binding protein [Thalictrum thalictroides]